MPPPEPERADRPVVLLTGASGYVGGRLLPLLERQAVVLRCLARNPDKLRPLVKKTTQVVQGDIIADHASCNTEEALIEARHDLSERAFDSVAGRCDKFTFGNSLISDLRL